MFESNFLQPCPEIFRNIVAKYNYRVIIILFDGDVKIINKRFLERDITSERHPGLVPNNYFSHFEVFKNATLPCKNFDYGDFKIVVDTTDFTKVNYAEITEKFYIYKIRSIVDFISLNAILNINMLIAIIGLSALIF